MTKTQTDTAGLLEILDELVRRQTARQDLVSRGLASARTALAHDGDDLRDLRAALRAGAQRLDLAPDSLLADATDERRYTAPDGSTYGMPLRDAADGRWLVDVDDHGDRFSTYAVPAEAFAFFGIVRR
jgi:hypothetical protein